MGTLFGDDGYLGSDEESLKASFKTATKSTLESGGGSILGVPIPLEIPTPELAAAQAQTIDNTEEFPIFAPLYAETIKVIDAALPPATPLLPIADWTYALPNLVPFLIDIGIENPLEWIETNWTNLDIVANSPCDPEAFAQHLKDIDPSIDQQKVEENSLDLCIPIPGLSINIPIPPQFSFDFSLNLLPIEMFELPNLSFPQLNFAIQFIFEAFTVAIGNLLIKIPEIIAAIKEGIIAFILFCIETIFDIIIALILAAIAPLLAGILFVAQLIAYIAKVTAAFIVALFAHLFGNGLITQLIADKLGLIE